MDKNRVRQLLALWAVVLAGMAAFAAVVLLHLQNNTKATPDGFKLISANYYGKEGHERLRKEIGFLDEIDAAIEEGDMSQAHQLVGDWRKELDDYLALNEKECGTHDDGAGDEAAAAKTKE